VSCILFGIEEEEVKINKKLIFILLVLLKLYSIVKRNLYFEKCWATKIFKFAQYNPSKTG